MLIGLTGYAQHGKDSTGKILVEEFGFTRYAFADQLKSMALALNPFVDREMKLRLWTVVQDRGWDEAKKEPEVRRFLQVLGTEAVRDHLGEDAWVRALEQRLVDDNLLAYAYTPQDGRLVDDARVVVTDVRFPNEAGWITKMGGKLWRIERLTKRTVRVRDGSDPGREEEYVPFDNGLGTDHPSEMHIRSLKADSVLVASNLEELQLEVQSEMRVSV